MTGDPVITLCGTISYSCDNTIEIEVQLDSCGEGEFAGTIKDVPLSVWEKLIATQALCDKHLGNKVECVVSRG